MIFIKNDHFLDAENEEALLSWGGLEAQALEEKIRCVLLSLILQSSL